MLLLFAPLLAKIGFGRFAAAASKALSVLLIVVAVIAALWFWGHTRYRAGVHDERARAELALEQANRRFLEQKARADQLAADRRLADTVAVNRQEKELLDAIEDTPDSAPDATRVALGCERLRRAGRDTSRIAACRRPGG